MVWNKRKKSVIAIYSIAAIVYILLSTVIPFSKPAASWITFAFTIVSFVLGAATSIYAFSKEETLVSKFYGYPVFRIGFIYTVIQIVISIVIFAIGAFVNTPYWIGLTVSILLLGLACIGVIATDNARDYVEEVDTKTFQTTKTLTKFSVDIFDLVDLCKCDAAKIPIKKLAEKFKYSDQVSSPATEEKESIIILELEKLKSLINANDEDQIIPQIEVVSNLLSSRNRICEASKGKGK